MSGVHIGVDVGETEWFAAVIDLHTPATIAFCPDTSPARVLEWCVGQRPDSIAIDAPAAHNAGLVSTGKRRVAEEQLGIGGCYGTPSTGAPLPPWMESGMRCHRNLSAGVKEAGLDLAGRGKVFEIHPTYGFQSLLGVTRQHDRVRCDPDRLLKPKRPRGSIGHRQRVQLLRVLLVGLGITWTEELEHQVVSSLDWTDAAIGAVLGALRTRGATLGIGNPSEGTIVIADPSRLGPLVAMCREAAVSNLEPLSPAATTVKRSPSAPHTDSDSALLRLGASGLGSLSQQDTVEALRGQDLEEQVLFPVGSRIGSEWIKRAESGGFWLLVCHGQRIALALRVVEVIGSGPENPTPKGELFGVNRDPWPGIPDSPYWLRCDQMLEVDLSVALVHTRQRGKWSPGFSRGMSAWLHARIADDGLRDRFRERDDTRLVER